MDGPFQQNNMENTPWNHMSQIERNSSYIHAQYRTILKRLHAEIDCLKSANRDLQFQLILLHQTKFAASNTSPLLLPTKSRSKDASVFNFGQNSLSSGVSSEHRLTTCNQQNEICSDVSSVESPPTIEKTSRDLDNLDERDYEKDIRPTENSAKQIFTEKPFENTLIENSDFLDSSDDETSDSPTDKTAEESSTRKPKDKTIRSATKNRPEGNLATDRSIRSLTKKRHQGNPARDKSSESLAKESHTFELDCTSKHCSLKMRCDQCQSYTPLTITKLTPHSKVKSLLNEICSSYNERFANSSNQPENREKQPLATVSQISNHRFSTNQIQDLTAALSLRSSQTQLYPSSSQTQLYPTNQNFHTANPNQTLNPIVHKTYVLSIEDTDPHSTNKKIQKTIVWSKRQTGTFESDGISETPCLLPPLQHWQESRCTTTVRQIQPSNTTPTLPEIVTKK